MANVVQAFGYTGAQQAFTVPEEVTELIVELWGAWGGNGIAGNPGLDRGGAPAYIKGTIACTPGDTYYIFVGGNGADGSGSNTAAAAGGFNGGGAGGVVLSSGYAQSAGGGGGGASDIRHGGTALSNRLMVAGGGGGAGGTYGPDTTRASQNFPRSPYPYDGSPYYVYYWLAGLGIGGYAQAGAGTAGGECTSGAGAAVASSGGAAGTLTAGGAASVGSGTGATGGTAGALGVGGAGGKGSNPGSVDGACGGGGGGGYYGGAGGGGGDLYSGANDYSMGGGGGAGSTWADPSVSAVSQIGPLSLGFEIDYTPAGFLDCGFAQISYVQPPTAPALTITTPNNSGVAGQYDHSQSLTVGWIFHSLANVVSFSSNSEVQTRFDIQYSSNGGTSWTETDFPGSNADSYTFPANFFTAGTTYEIQVRVYDSEGVASNWGPSTTFEAVNLEPAATITSPTAGSNVTSDSFTVTWTIPSGTQTDYEIEVADESGNVLYDSGDVASATESGTATITYSSAQNIIISVRYKISGGGGVWSTWATVTAFSNINPPATPVVNIGTDDDGGTISLAITNPAGTNATVSNDIYRTDLTNATAEIRIATGVTPNTTFTDYTVGSGIYYQYRVRAISASGGVADAT